MFLIFRDDLVDSENEIDVENIEAKTITKFPRDMEHSVILKELDMNENAFKDKFVRGINLRALKNLFNGIAHSKVDTKRDSYKRIIAQYCQDVAWKTPGIDFIAQWV